MNVGSGLNNFTGKAKLEGKDKKNNTEHARALQEPAQPELQAAGVGAWLSLHGAGDRQYN